MRSDPCGVVFADMGHRMIRFERLPQIKGIIVTDSTVMLPTRKKVQQHLLCIMV